MYADPQSLTVNAVAIVMPRVGTATPERRGSFRTADAMNAFEVRQDKTKTRFRREVRLTMKKVTTDPISALNKEISFSVIVAVDEPVWGFTDAELSNALTGLTTWVGVAANRDKLLGGEL